MNKLLEKKKKQYDELRIEIAQLEREEQLNIERPKKRQLVGTYWKFHNSYDSYSMPDEDYWWTYRYVSGMKADGLFIFDEFQIDKYGELRARLGQLGSWNCINNSWVRSSKREYYSALKKAKAIVGAL